MLEYLTKNFGLDKKPRAVKTDKEMPLDEAQLGKAQYIEYYVEADEKEAAAPARREPVASDSEDAAGGVAGVRVIMQVQIDAQGNRWAVDRGIPSRLVKLDPRTGEQKAWTLPDTRAGVHEIVMDRQGSVWVLEFTRNEEGKVDGMRHRLDELHVAAAQLQPEDREVGAHHRSRSRQRDPGDAQGPADGRRRRLQGQRLRALDVDRSAEQVRRHDGQGVDLPHSDAQRRAVRRDHRSVRQRVGRGVERRQARPVRHDDQHVDRIHAADLPGEFPAGSAVGRRGQHLGRHLGRRRNGPGRWRSWIRRRADGRLWDIPHRGSQPYETSIDKDGNIWFPDTSTSDRPMANVPARPDATGRSCSIRGRSSWPTRRA